jgi:hypothetical protein
VNANTDASSRAMAKAKQITLLDRLQKLAGRKGYAVTGSTIVRGQYQLTNLKTGKAHEQENATRAFTALEATRFLSMLEDE